ncbi:MAG TPA: TIGR02594 family protein [Terriglobales bacterium]|nr:TIGR02594 family protein [Terriglobales bacterium]
MFDRRKFLSLGGVLSASMVGISPAFSQSKKEPSKEVCKQAAKLQFREAKLVPGAAGTGTPRNEEVAKAFRLLFGVGTPTNPIDAAEYFSKLNDKNKDQELFREEWKSARANPMIVGFFGMTQTLPSDGDQTAWCAAFVNFCLFSAGYIGTESALSGSFRTYGEATTTPKRGDIIVFRNPGSAGDEGHGHVGFYYGEDQGRLQVLGGNQASPGSTGGVKIANFGRSSGSLELHSFRSAASFKKLTT